MNREESINALHQLGVFIRNLTEDEFQTIAFTARNENPWFDEANVRLSLKGISAFLDEETLRQWVSPYPTPEKKKVVAIVMAGNIPMVGFHDLLAVLSYGHNAQIKLSSKDAALMSILAKKLIEIDARFADRITVVERLKNFDAVIATGSDNTARYFDYYFAKYPNIIRKNRTSVAILKGDETDIELQHLGHDIFTYFGLGCRNVAKVFVPSNYQFHILFQQLEKFSNVVIHHKYCNNYDYQKSILLVNRVPFLDTGYVIFQESEKLVSPISVVYYEQYENEADLENKLSAAGEKIQVIVGKSPLAKVSFGEAQMPSLTDYADNVNTLDFLRRLN